MPFGHGAPDSALMTFAEIERYLLTREGFKPTTIKDMGRHWRAMERMGFSLAEFMRGPVAADRLATDILYRAKMDGRPANTLRNYGKVLNRCLLFAKAHDTRYRDMAPWRLEKAPRPVKERHTDAEMLALRDYRHPTPVIERRRRAMLSIAEHTGLRRSEVARLQRQDVVWHEGRWWLHVTPAKGGDRRTVPMPQDHIDARLAEWLDLRDAVASAKGPLWTKRGRGGLSPEKAGQEFWKIGQQLGFRVSFTKMRRTYARRLMLARVHGSVGMHALGHSSARVFEGYAGGITDQDLVAAYHDAGIPGF